MKAFSRALDANQRDPKFGGGVHETRWALEKDLGKPPSGQPYPSCQPCRFQYLFFREELQTFV